MEELICIVISMVPSSKLSLFSGREYVCLERERESVQRQRERERERGGVWRNREGLCVEREREVEIECVQNDRNVFI